MSNLVKKIAVSFLCGTAFITPAVIAAVISFSDVKAGNWFYNDVQNMVQWGVIKGYSDGTFKPNNPVNRAELSTMLSKYNTYSKSQFMAKDDQLYCDLFNSIFAEREYVYPILRELGYNPDNYGKDTKNPITTNAKYIQNCK